jgi:uncharacterized repeat protein (TIGR04052 family)
VGKVKPGTYTGVSMTLGVPYKAADGVSRLNHSFTAALDTVTPLQSTAMNWAWQFGRKFTKIEFVPDAPTVITKPSATNLAATTARWNVHLGSTGCTGNPALGLDTVCTNPNRVDMTFNAFNASSNKIALDLAELFKQADMTFDAGGAAGCMAGSTDPECAPIFNALGVSLVNGSTVTTGTVVAPTSTSFGAAVQSVFSVKL